MESIFVHIPISEYQKITPDPHTVYIVEKEPGLYSKNGTLLKTWEQLKEELYYYETLSGETLPYPCITVIDGELSVAHHYDPTTGEYDYGITWMYLNGILLISDEVTSIAANGFRGAHMLQGVIMPDTITSLNGSKIFMNNAALTNVVFSNSLTSLPDGMCGNGVGLEKIAFGDNIETIGESAFFYCTNIKTIELPSSLKTIGDGALRYIEPETMTIPASVTDIGIAALPFEEKTWMNGDTGEIDHIYPGLKTLVFEDPNNWSAKEKKDDGVTYVYPVDLSDSTENVKIFNQFIDATWHKGV